LFNELVETGGGSRIPAASDGSCSGNDKIAKWKWWLFFPSSDGGSPSQDQTSLTRL